MFNHEELKVYFRGEIVDFKDATISVSNTAFLYGLGVFTGIRAHYNEKTDSLYLFRPEAHYKRFRLGCKMMRYMNFLDTYDYPKFLSVLRELLTANNIKQDCYLRVTNFTDENKVTPKFIDYKDSLTVFLYPLGDYVPTGGMRCKVSSYVRSGDNSIPARIKPNGIYVNTAFAKTEALLGGYDEAIFLDRNGHVVEGSAENIFVVIDDVLITPPASDDILEGITRRSVLEIAKRKGIPFAERSIDRTELYRASEVFLTGTGAKVSPVVEIDQYSVGDGSVGPISKCIQETYFAAVRGELEEYSDWVFNVYESS